MLLVRTKTGPSAIDGIGLFADQFIKRGDLIWRFESGLDITISVERVDKLPAAAQAYLLRYAYRSTESDLYVLCFDDARYFNHSDTPNTRSIKIPGEPESSDFAIKDILPGEEITADYNEFDIDCAAKLRPVRGTDSDQAIHDLGLS